MECHLKLNVTQNGVAIKIKCHSNEISFIIKYQSNWNVIQIEISLKLECLLNWNVTKFECCSN